MEDEEEGAERIQQQRQHQRRNQVQQQEAALEGATGEPAGEEVPQEEHRRTCWQEEEVHTKEGVPYGWRRAYKKHFGIMESETAALMMALRKWRTYTQGNITTAITDHSSITSMLKPDKEFKNRKIANWAVEMSSTCQSMIKIIIAKRAGRVHFTADFISRCKREKDRAARDKLYKRLWGRTVELVPHLKLNELFHLYSNEARLNRLAYEVQNAQLIQETDGGGNRVYTVLDMIVAIEKGDRSLREQDLLIEDPDSRTLQLQS